MKKSELIKKICTEKGVSKHLLKGADLEELKRLDAVDDNLCKLHYDNELIDQAREQRKKDSGNGVFGIFAGSLSLVGGVLCAFFNVVAAICYTGGALFFIAGSMPSLIRANKEYLSTMKEHRRYLIEDAEKVEKELQRLDKLYPEFKRERTLENISQQTNTTKPKKRSTIIQFGLRNKLEIKNGEVVTNKPEKIKKDSNKRVVQKDNDDLPSM